MNIAELFIKLGIKGEGDSGKKIKGVDKNLTKVKHNSIATKAAIVGVVYGLERLMSNAASSGSGLTKFSRSTELSIKELQKWEHAGRKVGVTQEEIRGGLTSIQAAMSSMQAGGAMPEGFGRMGELVKDFDESKLNDTFYMLRKIQSLAQTVDAATARRLVTSFGLSENFFGAMRKNSFTLSSMKGALAYTDEEAKKLQEVEASWKGIYKNIEMAMGSVSAKHGAGIVKQLEILIPQMTKFVGIVAELGEEIKVFEKLGKVIENLGNLLSWTGFFTGMAESARMTGSVKEMVSNMGNSGASLDASRVRNEKALKEDPTNIRVMYQLAQIKKAQKENIRTKNVNVNNNIKIDGAKDPRAVAEEIKKSVNQTYRGKLTSQES